MSRSKRLRAGGNRKPDRINPRIRRTENRSPISSTQTALKDVNRLLKLDPTNTELLAQKQKLLQENVKGTKEKYETLKIAKEQLDQKIADGTATDEEKQNHDALQRELIESKHAYEEAQKAAKNFNPAIEGASARFSEFGNKAESAGKKLLPVSAGIVAVGGAAAKMSMDFEDAMAKLHTIMDTSEVSLKDMEEAVLSLSNQTGISSTEIADNVYNAISAGQKTGDAVNFVSNSTKLAKAGFADAGNALDILTTILNAYGLEAKEVTRVSDILIQTQNLGKTTVADLSTNMGRVIPTAKANGVALEQVAAGYAKMTANGVATAETTTYINSMLNELGKSGTKTSDVLKKETGKTFAELMNSGMSLADVLQVVSDAADKQGLSFSDMFGSAEASKSAMILLGDSAQEFNGILGEMQNSTGATDSAFEKLQTNSYTAEQAINTLKNTGIELGNVIMQALGPVIESLAEKISQLAKWFSGLDDGTKNMILTIVGIVAAVGPFLIMIGKIATGISGVITIAGKIGPLFTKIGGAFKALGAAMMANPISIVIVAIAALIAIFIALWNNCEGFRNFWIGLWEKIKEGFGNFVENFKAGIEIVKIIFNVLKNFISEKISAIGDFFTSIGNAIVGTLADIVGWVREKIQAIENVFNSLNEWLGGIFQTDWSEKFGAFGEILNGFFQNVQNIWESIKSVFTGIIDFIKNVFTGNWKGAWDAIKQIFKGIFDGLVSVAKAPINGIIGLVNGLLDGINKGIGMINKIRINVPDWVPAIGGKQFGFNISKMGKIPYLAKGTDDWIGGMAVINEKGGELVNLPKHSQVVPHDVSMEHARALAKAQAGANNSGINVTIQKIVISDDHDPKKAAEEMMVEFQKILRRKGLATGNA